MNPCLRCRVVAVDTFIEGRAEVLLDSGEVAGENAAFIQAAKDMTVEDIAELLDGTTCADFHGS